MSDIIVGYQGVEGSYSEEALLKYFGDTVKKTNVKEFKDVFKGIMDDSFNYGILPIENSSTGGVIQVYDLMRSYGFSIVGEICIDVRHNLLCLSDIGPEDIREIYSHPQAISQCEEFLSGLDNVKIIPTLNTAISAKLVKESGDCSKAAIASSRAGDIYGLRSICDGINYNKKNLTRFIIISKEPIENDDADKVSIVFSTEHKPGSLFNVLSYFAEEGLNLLKLESRPMLDYTWEYFFYIDFEGNTRDVVTDGVLDRIKNETSYFNILGNYKKHEMVAKSKN